jgi:formate-dependent nitrite reductase membrane component NrfD
MTTMPLASAPARLPLLRFLLSELKPKGPLLTPFNVISIPVILLGIGVLVQRFIYGLGSITNLTQEHPWGLGIGFDVVTGVALAGGAYTLAFAVYVMRLEKYHPIIRATVLNGLLAYIFYAGALVLDLGRPWNVINPVIGNSFGYNSVLFQVAWSFLLYMLVEMIELSPAFAEWLGWKRARRFLASLALGAVIIGVTLSTLHQAGLGALFLMAKPKIHPLWYTEFIPILFFVSSIFGGLSMVILEGTLTHRPLRQADGPQEARLVRRSDARARQGHCDRSLRLLLLQAPDLPARAPMGSAGDRVGGLVPGRGDRLRAGAVRDVRLCGAPPPAGAPAVGRGRGARRPAAQSPEHLDRRLQLAARRALLPELAGVHRDPDGPLHRSLGLPLDRAAHADSARCARAAEPASDRVMSTRISACRVREGG